MDASHFSMLDGLLPTGNPFFTGGFGLAVIGAGFATLRRSWTLGVGLARRHLLSTVEITSKDRAFPWVLQWLSSQGGGSQHLSVETSFLAAVNSVAGSGPSIHSSAVFGFVPGPGMHIATYRRKWIAVERIREHQSTDLNSGKPWEKVTLTIIGNNTKLFSDLLQEAFSMASQQQEGKTVIFTNWGSEWRPFGQPRKRRPLDSVVLDAGIADSILSDVQEWRSSARWYIERGIPYRRGYLLHGPPGSGKSSFITAIAGHLNYNICVLNLAEHGLTDDRLSLALSTVPPQSVVLLEDIDAAFVQREAGNSFSRLTFSGLLNALDGVASAEERLVFMTTNHIDRLDAALIRPGRVDLVVRLENATRHQFRYMFDKFFPDTQQMVRTRPEIRVALQQARQTRLGIADSQVSDVSLKDINVSSTSTTPNTTSTRVLSTSSHVFPSMAEEFAYLLMPNQSSVIRSSNKEIMGEVSLLSAAQVQDSAPSSISMAQLQGYLLVHKHDAWAAYSQAQTLMRVPTPVSSSNTNPTSQQVLSTKQPTIVPRMRGIGVTAREVDRMFYNPQGNGTL